MNIFVGGVNGSGKTTILDLVGALRPDWMITRSSQAFMAWLGFPNDYARLQKMDPTERDHKLTQFMRVIMDRDLASHQLLDSHYLNLKHSKIESVTGPWLKNFGALVLVSTPASVIIDRLQGTDRFRDRALFSGDSSPQLQVGLLQSYVDKTETEFLSVASKFNLPHAKIKNLNKDHAARELIQFVESLSS